MTATTTPGGTAPTPCAHRTPVRAERPGTVKSCTCGKMRFKLWNGRWIAW